MAEGIDNKDKEHGRIGQDKGDRPSEIRAAQIGRARAVAAAPERHRRLDREKVRRAAHSRHLIPDPPARIPVDLRDSLTSHQPPTSNWPWPLMPRLHEFLSLGTPSGWKLSRPHGWPSRPRYPSAPAFSPAAFPWDRARPARGRKGLL